MLVADHEMVQVLQLIEDGGRLDCPEDCPPYIYAMMRKVDAVNDVCVCVCV